MGESKRPWFRVWAGCNHQQDVNDDYYFSLPAKTSKRDVDATCSKEIRVLIGNSFDTGWDEVDESEVPAEFKEDGDG